MSWMDASDSKQLDKIRFSITSKGGAFLEVKREEGVEQMRGDNWLTVTTITNIVPFFFFLGV